MKRNIIIRIKFALLKILLAVGFLFLDTYLWFAVGLPQNGWAAVILAVLSVMSTICFIRWLAKEDHVPVRCRACRHWMRHEEGQKMGTCYCRGFNHGVDTQENGYCHRAEHR